MIGQDDRLVHPGAQLHVLAGKFQFVHGPLVQDALAAALLNMGHDGGLLFLEFFQSPGIGLKLPFHFIQALIGPQDGHAAVPALLFSVAIAQVLVQTAFQALHRPAEGGHIPLLPGGAQGGDGLANLVFQLPGKGAAPGGLQIQADPVKPLPQVPVGFPYGPRHPQLPQSLGHPAVVRQNAGHRFGQGVLGLQPAQQAAGGIFLPQSLHFPPDPAPAGLAAQIPDQDGQLPLFVFGQDGTGFFPQGGRMVPAIQKVPQVLKGPPAAVPVVSADQAKVFRQKRQLLPGIIIKKLTSWPQFPGHLLIKFLVFFAA